MSFQSTSTVYTVNMNDAATYIQGTFNQNNGFTDAFMLELGAALNGLTWPSGTSFQIGKQVIVETAYNADYAQNPTVFD